MDEIDRHEGESAGDYTARLKEAVGALLEAAELRHGQIEALGERLDAQDETFERMRERETQLEREVADARIATAGQKVDERTHVWWQTIAREEKADNRQLRAENSQLHRQVITAQTNADSWERMYHEAKDSKGSDSKLDEFLMTFIAARMAEDK